MSYAEDTSVPVERSRAEIERILSRYGATHFGYTVAPGYASLGFRTHDRTVRFDVPLPGKDERRFTHTESKGFARSPQQAEQAWEQACRQRWRALSLVVKAKLEAVASGITTFEDEFMAHIVLPDGRTFGQWARPQIARAYTTREMPPMLEYRQEEPR